MLKKEGNSRRGHMSLEEFKQTAFYIYVAGLRLCLSWFIYGFIYGWSLLFVILCITFFNKCSGRLLIGFWFFSNKFLSLTHGMVVFE